MRRRIKANTLYDKYGTSYPSPTERVIDISTLNGGLNLWELDYRLNANQSPDSLNVYWKDGSLSSRQGQSYTYDSTIDTSHQYGSFYACYERPWQTYLIAHKGTKLYKIKPETGVHTQIYSGTLTEGAGGTFFVFGDKLYYMNGHEYISINLNCVATVVEPYIPLVIVNRTPSGTGGSTVEDENRLSPKKRIRFTTDGSSVNYNIPSGYTPMDGVCVKAELSSPSVISYKELQTYASRSAFPTTGYADIYYKATAENKYYKYIVGSGYSEVTAPTLNQTFSVNRTTGVITFNTAPAVAPTQSPSNLEITVSKADADTQNSILNCTCATVYGGDKELAVICGGTPKQPNAYFWSGSTSAGLDPTYFPFDYYNYAGANAEEYITGFGKQQNMLVIFKERSIGKSYFEITNVKTSSDDTEGTDYLKLPYKAVNNSIGCNLGKTIKLIENNLVFANTYGGVYVLLDTSAYGENTIKRLSRNVNGDGTKKTGGIAVRTYPTRASFPATGYTGAYFCDQSTQIYYLWDTGLNDYVVSRPPFPSSGLLYDLRQVASTAIIAFDDQQRYWLSANGHAYLWDYTISSYQSKEENLSWFYFDNIQARGWYKTIDKNYYGIQNGSIVGFTDSFNDFGGIFVRRYTFATQNFGTYEVLKDVLKVIFSVRSDTDSAITITYKTDHEIREDLTPIRAYSWRLSPRDLTHRSLRPIRFAETAVRKPRCFHIKHFTMVLENSVINTDLSIVSAQIVYRYNREDR